MLPLDRGPILDEILNPPLLAHNMLTSKHLSGPCSYKNISTMRERERGEQIKNQILIYEEQPWSSSNMSFFSFSFLLPIPNFIARSCYQLVSETLIPQYLPPGSIWHQIWVGIANKALSLSCDSIRIISPHGKGLAWSRATCASRSLTHLQRHHGTMNPNIKLILNELLKRFGDMELKLDKRFAVQESWFDQKL